MVKHAAWIGLLLSPGVAPRLRGRELLDVGV